MCKSAQNIENSLNESKEFNLTADTAAKFKAIRKSLKIPLNQLNTSIRKQEFNRFETGKYNIRLDTLQKLCDAIGCDVTIELRLRNKKKDE